MIPFFPQEASVGSDASNVTPEAPTMADSQAGQVRTDWGYGILTNNCISPYKLNVLTFFLNKHLHIGRCHSNLKLITFKLILTHWGRVTHLCVGKLNSIGSDNGSLPGRRQAIIWTNAGILSIGPSGTNFNEIFIEIYTFSFKKMHLKMSSGKWWPFCLGLNVLRVDILNISWEIPLRWMPQDDRSTLVQVIAWCH